jgi:hypothetical protein
MQAHRYPPVDRASHRRLRLNALDWAIYAIVALCTIGGWAFTCTKSADIGQCMRDGAPALLGVLLQAAVLVGAVWAGSEIGRRSQSTIVGLSGGTVLFLLASALLSVLGLSPLGH